MPGGLARVNTDASSSLVSSMSGAIAKDVWVLSDDTAGVGGWRGASSSKCLRTRPQGESAHPCGS